MIGDSPVDIQSAQNAGALSAGVAWSLKGEQVLSGYKPDYILHDMRDLLDMVLQERDVHEKSNPLSGRKSKCTLAYLQDSESLEGRS